MFKRAKRKIVFSILAILCAVLIGTLGLIYLTSYLSVTSQNFETLERRAEMLAAGKEIAPKGTPDKNTDRPAGQTPDRGRIERRIETGTFYAVRFGESGGADVIENGADGVYSDDELIALAKEVRGESRGKTGELLYVVTSVSGETTVSFMDNTVFTESFSRLFSFTLLFGVIAIIAITFISVRIANRIVTPMEQTYEKQKQFTADAGHELKTPIAAVSANAEMLRREIGENRWLDNIEFENERMKALVTELLELAKNENRAANKSPTDLSRLVTGAVLPLEATAFEKGVIIESDITPDVTVSIDEQSVGQLVTILVDNAISHTLPDGDDKKTVKVALSPQKGGAALTVTNPGEAIPEGEREKIFERFYRTDDSREYSGHYGLGLAIAKAIADKNGANISVSCPEGEICFKVVFRQN